MYTLINPRTGERIPCRNLAELVNAWVVSPHCTMTAVGAPESEQQAIVNIYAMHDQLRAAKRERFSMSAAMMRQVYRSEEGVVL